MEGVKLGQRVRYARLRPDGTEHVGYGAVVSIHLSADNHPQVRVHDGADERGKPNLYNIDHVAINATEAGEKRYFDHLRAIQKRAEEITEAQKELVKNGNKDLAVMSAEVLGQPIVPDYGPEDEEEGNALSA